MTTLAVAPKNSPLTMPTEEFFLPNDAWFAGLFDGEGCVPLNEKVIKGRQRTFGVQITCGNTFGRAVKLFQLRFGGACDIYQAGTRGRKRKFYNWRLSGFSEVALALEAMLPHLIIKQQQAKLVLEYCRLPWRGSGGQRTPKEVATDLEYATKVSALKFETPQYSWE